MDSYGNKAGKGPLIAEEISNTLGTAQDQYLFQPIGVDLYNQCLTGDKAKTLNAIKSDADHVPVVLENKVINLNKGDVQSKAILDPKGISPALYAGECKGGGGECYILESHPNDSRVKIDGSGTIQTLTSRMGTGGGNVPMVMMPFSKRKRAQSATDFETWKESRVSNTINTFDQGDVRATDVVVCIQGNVIDRSDNAGANGAGWRMDKCYTLNTIDRPAVVYPKKTGPLMANSHPGSYSGQDAYQDMFVVERVGKDSIFSLDEKMGQTYIHENIANTLAAMDYKQPQIIAMNERAMSMVTSEGVANTLAATDYKGSQVIAIDRAAFNQGENAKYDFSITGGGTAQTIVARGPGAVCYRKPVRERLQVPTAATSERREGGTGE